MDRQPVGQDRCCRSWLSWCTDTLYDLLECAGEQKNKRHGHECPGVRVMSALVMGALGMSALDRGVLDMISSDARGTKKEKGRSLIGGLSSQMWGA